MVLSTLFHNVKPYEGLGRKYLLEVGLGRRRLLEAAVRVKVYEGFLLGWRRRDFIICFKYFISGHVIFVFTMEVQNYVTAH